VAATVSSPTSSETPGRALSYRAGDGELVGPGAAPTAAAPAAP